MAAIAYCPVRHNSHYCSSDHICSPPLWHANWP